GTKGPQLLAVSIQGSFGSFFKNKASPFAASTTPVPGPTPTPNPTTVQASASLVTQSPDTARLVVVGSAEFLNDTVFQLSARLNNDYTQNNLQFVQNSLDWFTQDTALASIRSKGSESRVLNPISDTAKTLWEVGNYVFALLSVIALGVIWQLRRRAEKPI